MTLEPFIGLQSSFFWRFLKIVVEILSKSNYKKLCIIILQIKFFKIVILSNTKTKEKNVSPVEMSNCFANYLNQNPKSNTQQIKNPNLNPIPNTQLIPNSYVCLDSI